MTKIKNEAGLYLCDFCKYTVLDAFEQDWERLEDGRDRCVECIIAQRDKLLENNLVNWGCSCGTHYLEVAGITTVVEGDIKRESNCGEVWTAKDIKEVVKQYEDLLKKESENVR